MKKSRLFMQFVLWMAICNFCVALATGLVLFFFAWGSDAYVLEDPFWRLGKWYLLDVFVISFALAALAFAGCLAARAIRASKAFRRRSTPWKSKRILRRTLPAAAAVLATFMAARCVVDEHPVLVAPVRTTPAPSTNAPDQVVLTFSGDPETTQALQWRTSRQAPVCELEYRRLQPPSPWATAKVTSSDFVDRNLARDHHVIRHEATLDDLEPASAYAYRVLQKGKPVYAGEFETAPLDSSFSFIYMGDAQNGLFEWGQLVQKSFREHPEASFYIVAGDLVNYGDRRGDWDLFFDASDPVFARRPLVPAIGNHEAHSGNRVDEYLQLFDLPENGPQAVEAERAYSFEYANALFVVLDSNLPPASQADWLEETLSKSAAAWKFVVVHHPIHSFKEGRDNWMLRRRLAPIFEAYGVDLVLQGHNHAYSRTHPLRDGQIVEPGEGPIYIVSVSGTKYYRQGPSRLAAVAFTHRSTYQHIDIDGGMLRYRAFAENGELVDKFTLRKIPLDAPEDPQVAP